jgi:hypothetical protein
MVRLGTNPLAWGSEFPPANEKRRMHLEIRRWKSRVHLLTLDVACYSCTAASLDPDVVLDNSLRT